MINKYDAFIFDLDGTIYRGSSLIPDADKAVNSIKALGKKVIFISNKTTGNVDDYFSILNNYGINTTKDEIVNATVVLKKFLIKNHASKSFYAIGEKIFIKEIESAGLKFIDNPDKIDLLLVTLDRTLSYEKLEIAARALEAGARFYAANIDDTCPVDGGEVLDAGATISALEKRTHRKLEMNFGKPSQFMFDEVTSRLNTTPSKILLIGDRLETDITMGFNFGIDTALVDTGVKFFANGTPLIKPTYHLNSVADLLINL